MAVSIKSGVSSDVQTIDPASKAGRITTYDTKGNKLVLGHRDLLPANQEYLVISGKNDEYATAIRTDRKGNLMTGNYIPEIIENFEGTSINAQKWTQTATTFSPAMGTAGGYTMNSTTLTTANAVNILQSQRFIYKYARVPLQLKSRLRVNIPANAVADFGFGIPSSTTLIVPNGCAVRIVNGLWSAVITYNNSELLAVNITDKLTGVTQLTTANASTEYYVVDMIIDDDNLVVTVQNTQTNVMVGYAIAPVPFTALKMWGATSLPIYYRVYNTGTSPATAPIFNLTDLQALSLDMNVAMDSNQLAGHLGLTAGRHPSLGTPLENHTNSTAPVAATLSNTVAGYTTNGGKWLFNAIAGATTDYALFAYQIPVGTRFVCEGIRIESRNTVIAVATTPTTLEWAMGFNSSSVSLATGNIIRRQIGTQSFAVGAGVEATAPVIDVDFRTPEVVESNRFLHVILQIPVGTATATEAFRGQVLIKGRFI
jgi:hypothetical protein